jgi:hypothetical protein
VNPDLIRWVCAGLAGIDVVLLTAGSYAHWHTFTPRMKRIVPWVLATYVVIAYGFGEVAGSRTPVPTGIRVPMFAVVLSGLLVALVYRIDDPDAN